MYQCVHARMGAQVRNNSKDRWLWRGGGEEEMSEDTRAKAVQAIFASPLPHTCGRTFTEAGVQDGDAGGGGRGLLMEALMGNEAPQVAASLMSRAKGDAVASFTLPTDPDFKDGWAHDDSVAILAAFSTQQHAPSPDRNGDRNLSGAADAPPAHSGTAAAGGSGSAAVSLPRVACKGQEAVYAKLHVQPVHIRLSPSALQCCVALLSNLVPLSRQPPQPTCQSTSRPPRASEASRASSSASIPSSPFLRPAPPRARGGQGLQRVWIDFRLAGMDVAYVVEDALRSLEDSVILADATRIGIPCCVFSVGQCFMTNCYKPPSERGRAPQDVQKGDGGCWEAGERAVVQEYSGRMTGAQVYLSTLEAGKRKMGPMQVCSCVSGAMLMSM